MNFFKRKNGITLLALIVTIVVLLILTSITLYYTLGPNGLFQRAQLNQKEVGEFQLNEEAARNEFLDEYYHGDTFY